MRLNKRKTAAALKFAFFFIMEIGEIAKSCFVLAENNIFSWFRHGRFSTVYPEAAWSPSPKKREIKVHTMVHFHALKAVSSIYRQEIMSDCVWNRSLRVWLLQPQAELRSKREKHTRIEMNVVVLHFRFQTITIAKDCTSTELIAADCYSALSHTPPPTGDVVLVVMTCRRIPKVAAPDYVHTVSFSLAFYIVLRPQMD